MEIVETTTKVNKVNTKKIVDSFVSSVDVDTKYTLDELKKLLSEAYKSAGKKKDKSETKREPSKYNIFVKDEILRLRSENPDKNIKELMAVAAANWKKQKEGQDVAVEE